MNLRATCASAALLSGLAVSPAIAQTAAVQAPTPTTAASDGAAAVGEVVVTAQRRTQLLQDVPISASVTSGSQIARANLLDLTSIAVRTPAVHISTTPSSDIIVVRGVGSSLNNGFEQSVSTFVDGLYRGRSRSTRAALFDVDRVEILKGPQTTFFGNNAIAGAFNITTRKPGDTLQANATLFYAPDTSERTFEAGVSAPLNDSLSVRIAARTTQGGSYLNNTNLHTSSPDLDQQIGRVSVRWRPTEKVETNFRFDIGRQRDQRTNDLQLLHCPADPTVFGAPRGLCARYLAASSGRVDDKLDDNTASNPSSFNLDFLEAEQSTSVDFGWARLIATSGYFKQKYTLITDSVPVPPRAGGSVTTANAVGPSNFMESFDQFSQELRLQSPPSEAFEYMAGVYYSSGHLRLNQYQGLYFTGLGALAPGIYTASTPIAFHIVNKEDEQTFSVFGSATVHLGPQWRLNLGLRYSQVDKTAHRATELGVGGDLPGPGQFQAGPDAAQAILLPAAGVDRPDFPQTSRTDQKLMPAVSLQYKPTPDHMLYASVTRGFKAGGFAAYSSNSVFGPEGVTSYEAGLKSRLWDHRLSIDLTGYLADYSNLQESTTVIISTGAVRQQVLNVAASRSKGLELAVALRPLEGLTLSTELAYLDARYTKYPNAPCTALQALTRSPCNQDLAGKRRAFAPEFSGDVSAAYERPISSTLELRLDGAVYFTSSYFLQPIADPLLTQPAYAKVDARIAIATRDRRWELAVVGKNLTNKRTLSFMQNTPTSPGSFQALEDPTRVIGVQLNFNY